MTWFCVSKIFGPVGPEKMVICDRSAFAERSCRGGHWPSEKLRFAEITGYVHAGRFRMTNGHPCGEYMALHSRGRCPHRPAPGRLRHGEWEFVQNQIRRTWGADGGTGNPSPTTPQSALPTAPLTSSAKGGCVEPRDVRCMIARNAIDHAGVDNPSVICFANATADCQGSATQPCKISAGVFQSRHFLGRLLIRLSTN